MLKRLIFYAFTLSFTAQNPLFAQNGSDELLSFYQNNNTQNHTSSTQTAGQNRQYFFVTTKGARLADSVNAIKDEFLRKGFTSVEIDVKTSSLKIIAPKGKKIEDVKTILAGFKMAITDYREEYSSAAPTIF